MNQFSNIQLNGLGVLDSEIISIASIDFKDFINRLSNFICLDISVESSGWLRVKEGVISFGIKSLESKDSTERRSEFKEFLKSLAGKFNYDYLLVEDVIGSCNTKTAKELYTLNVIPDDLIVDKFIKINELIRRDNKVWKKYLRKASNYKGNTKGLIDKEMIVICDNSLSLDKFIIDKVKNSVGNIDANIIKLISYNINEDDKVDYIVLKNKKVIDKKKEVLLSTKNILGYDIIVPQDIYDAVGLCIAVSYELFVDKKSKTTNKKNLDIRKGYIIKQFDILDDALEFARVQLNIESPLYHSIQDKYKDIVIAFKKISKDYDIDYYIIECNSSQLGSLALDKDLDISEDLTYIIAYKNKRRRST